MNCFKSKNWTIPVIAGLLIFSAACNPFSEKEGCTDPNALNYDSDAEVDDGSCEYPQGGTEIDDDITSDFTFENNIADSTIADYTITDHISIEADVTIEPGVVIEFASEAGFYVAENGSLKAVGQPGNRIKLRGATATPGFWEEIEFNSNNPNNIFEYVVMEDAGSNNVHFNSAIWLQNNVSTQFSLKNSVIQNTKGYGLTAESGTTLSDFENNVFRNNGNAGVRLTSNNIENLDENTIYNDGNAEPYIYVEANAATNDATWPSPDAPYFIDDVMEIEADITLKPGTDFLMASEAGLYVSDQGSFNAVGTASEPITFIGETQTPGFWEEIELNSNNPANEFEYVELAYGGSNSVHNYSTIWIQNNVSTKFTMNNCTIRDSYGWGLYVESGTDVTPSSKSAMEAANTFTNNGTGTNANCSGNCSVNNF